MTIGRGAGNVNLSYSTHHPLPTNLPPRRSRHRQGRQHSGEGCAGCLTIRAATSCSPVAFAQPVKTTPSLRSPRGRDDPACPGKANGGRRASSFIALRTFLNSGSQNDRSHTHFYSQSIAVYDQKLENSSRESMQTASALKETERQLAHLLRQKASLEARQKEIEADHEELSKRRTGTTSAKKPPFDRSTCDLIRSILSSCVSVSCQSAHPPFFFSPIQTLLTSCPPSTRPSPRLKASLLLPRPL